MRKRLKASLTLRILCVTCALLLAASAVTYGIIALTTPISYTSITTSLMLEQAAELPAQLEQSTLGDCMPILEAFIRDTDASVSIFDEEGKTVLSISDHSAFASVEAAFETPASPGTAGSGEVAGDAAGSGEVAADAAYSVDVSGVRQTAAYGEAFTEVVVTTTDLNYPFSFQGDSQVYTLFITPPVQGANQTLQALGQVAPWLLCVMLLFSALCAWLYSRWLTRPIVRLSAISQKMAELDFSWRCEETRADEIGVLGRSLDTLSDNLSTALDNLQSANAALRQDIDRERELERQRLAFFSAASHELKTPVTILKGQLTGMLEGVGDYRDKERYLAKALGVTGRMEGLVQEILTVSRMESGGFALHCSRFDLAGLARGQLALDEDLIGQKGLRTKTDLPEGIFVSADAALMKKVLDNILSNAVFYAPEGAELAVSLAVEGGSPVLRIENGDSHIPEEALPHVFEAFYRAEGSRNRRTGGSGLGLYIVRMILDRHGFRHKIENTRRGVQFTIWFDGGALEA